MSLTSRTDTGGLHVRVKEWRSEEEKRLERISRAICNAGAAQRAAEVSNVIWKELGERCKIERLLASKKSSLASLELYDIAIDLLVEAADTNMFSEALKAFTKSGKGAGIGVVPDRSFRKDRRRRRNYSWNHGNFQLLATSDIRLLSPDQNCYGTEDVEKTAWERPNDEGEFDEDSTFLNGDREVERPTALNFFCERRGERLLCAGLTSDRGIGMPWNEDFLDRLQTEQQDREVEIERQFSIIEMGIADEVACMDSCRRMTAAEEARLGAGVIDRPFPEPRLRGREIAMGRWEGMEEDARASWEQYVKMDDVLRRCRDQTRTLTRLVLINNALRQLHVDPDMLELQLERADDMSAEAKALREIIADTNWTNP
jgi:hypothetical protein